MINVRNAGHDFREQCLVGGTRGEVGVDRLRNFITMLQQQRSERLQVHFAFFQCRHPIKCECLLLLAEYPLEPDKLFAGLLGWVGLVAVVIMISLIRLLQMNEAKLFAVRHIETQNIASLPLIAER